MTVAPAPSAFLYLTSFSSYSVSTSCLLRSVSAATIASHFCEVRFDLDPVISADRSAHPAAFASFFALARRESRDSGPLSAASFLTLHSTSLRPTSTSSTSISSMRFWACALVPNMTMVSSPSSLRRTVFLTYSSSKTLMAFLSWAVKAIEDCASPQNELSQSSPAEIRPICCDIVVLPDPFLPNKIETR